MSRAREVSKIVATVDSVENSIDNIGNIDLSSTINTASAAAVAYLIDGAPEALNTLNELAAALNDNESFATTVTNELSSKLSISSASTTYITQSSASALYDNIEQFMTVAISDESTSITSGTNKLTMRSPYAMTLTKIPKASLNTVSSSGNPTVDINLSGTSILGANKLSIDANEKTSSTAATATTLATTSIPDDSEITFDIDTAGTGAKGLKVVLYYKRS
jgi:hypothetical protein